MRLLNPGAFVWLFVAVVAAFVTITICQPAEPISAHHPSLQRDNKDQDKTRQRNGTKSEEQGTVRQKNGTKSEEQDKTHQKTIRRMPCQDLKKLCKSWAAAGECEKNPDFMDVYCAKSCGKCDERELEEMWELINELQAFKTTTLKEMQDMKATINDVESSNKDTRRTLNEVKEKVESLSQKVGNWNKPPWWPDWPGGQPPVMRCEPTWMQYRWSCYKVFKIKVTHAEAKAACRAQNAYLASIGSEGENSFVTGMVQEYTYIGLSDEIQQGVYRWDDRSPFVYSKWGNHEPHQIRDEDYVCIDVKGYWHDISNPWRIHYACEKSYWRWWPEWWRKQQPPLG